jgi:uncharacterized surface protein with fasciclin (FAS1) repeats
MNVMQTIQSVLEEQVWPRAYSTLDTAIRAVGLEYTLQGHKPVTLFAPDDLAFNQLHQGAIFDLLKDITLLRRLIEYHIVPLTLSRATLMQLTSSSIPQATGTPQSSQDDQQQGQTVALPTMSGHLLRVTFSDGFRVQGTRVLEPELNADNGVIHPVEGVLWPPDLSEASFGERSPLSFRR